VRSDVYPPEMEKTSAKKLFEFLVDGAVLLRNNMGDIDERVMDLLQVVIKYKDSAMLAGTPSEFKGSRFGELEKVCQDFFSLDPIKSDALKLKIIKLESTHYEAQSYLQEKFDIYYCEKLSIANFAVGYYSGEYPDLEEKVEGAQEHTENQSILRKFDGKYRPEFDDYILHGSAENVWPVFYNTFKTEGILFIPKESTIKKFEMLKELKTALHTLSHTLIKNAPKYSGIDEGNLKEFFFSDGSFLLFSIEPGKFRTKGLKRIFDNHLVNLFTDAEESLDCPFQYLNSKEEHDSGCGACTMLSNNCINQNLSIAQAVKIFE